MAVTARVIWLCARGFGQTAGLVFESVTCFFRVFSIFKQLDPIDFPVDIDDDDDVSTNRYAYLIVKTNNSDVNIDKEVKVLVSFSDGIVLLQTDKPIYTPQQSGSLEYTKGRYKIMS